MRYRPNLSQGTPRTERDQNSTTAIVKRAAEGDAEAFDLINEWRSFRGKLFDAEARIQVLENAVGELRRQLREELTR